MKKILSLLIFVFSFANVFSQSNPYPVIQGLGNTPTTLIVGNAIKERSFIYTTFVDTTAANSYSAYLKTYPFATIATTSDSSLWLRNVSGTGWMRIASSVGSTNIYNSNGSLTSDRVLSGTNLYNLRFDAVTSFRAEANASTGKVSSMNISPDSVLFQPNEGIFIIDSLASGASTDSVLLWTQATGRVKKRSYSSFTPTWQQTLTAGSTLTTSNTALLNGTEFTFRGFNTNNKMVVGDDGVSSFYNQWFYRNGTHRFDAEFDIDGVYFDRRPLTAGTLNNTQATIFQDHIQTYTLKSGWDALWDVQTDGTDENTFIQSVVFNPTGFGGSNTAGTSIYQNGEYIVIGTTRKPNDRATTSPYKGLQIDLDHQVRIDSLLALSTQDNIVGVVTSDGQIGKVSLGSGLSLSSGVLNTSGTVATPISSLTAATGTNSIDNTSSMQTWQWNSISSGIGLNLFSNSTAANANSQELVRIQNTGANANSTQTTTGLKVFNQKTGTSSTNVSIFSQASGGTNNYAIIVPASGGDVGIGTSTPTSLLHVVSTQTTGVGNQFSSSTTTTGTILDITGTSTALAAGNEGLNIGISGANGTNGITATGARISVTNTNATSGTNVGLDLTASGATTANNALNIAAGAIALNGSAGTTGQFLTSAGASGLPTWTTPTVTSPAGNFGNLQINRNSAFATPASDSLDWESATGLSITGNLSASVQTTTPLIYGSSAANGDIEIKGTSSATKTTSYVNLQSDGGNVGIGTATPANLLNIVSASNPSMVITQTGGQSAGLLAGSAGSSFEATNGGFFAIALEPLVSFGSGNDYALKMEGSTKNAHFGNLTYLTADQSAQLAVTTSSASKVAFKVNAAASQTADLQQWNNSSGTALAVVNSSGSVGIGTTSPSAKLHTISTTEQLRLGYDASNYYSTTVGSTGGVTFNAVGSGSGFTFSDGLTVNNSIAFSGTGAGNAGNITWGTGYGSPALTLYDGGAATRYGWGIQPFDMQFFMPSTAGHFFSWNGGGDFQTAGTNELMRLDANTGNLGIGATTVSARLHSLSTTEQLRVGYDASNYYSTTVGSTGGVTFNAVGSGSAFTFSDNLDVTGVISTDGLNADRTITAGGTTGNQTINKMAGTVNFAAAATTLTVTNSLVDANSIIFCVIRTNDATATIKNVVPGAGSFVITLGAAATAETSVGFIVTN